MDCPALEMIKIRSEDKPLAMMLASPPPLRRAPPPSATDHNRLRFLRQERLYCEVGHTAEPRGSTSILYDGVGGSGPLGR